MSGCATNRDLAGRVNRALKREFVSTWRCEPYLAGSMHADTTGFGRASRLR